MTFTAPAISDWERGQDLTHFWLDQMAHDCARPFQERMAFFWHGHFCSEFGKVGSSMLMREQIDLWRREGLGNVHTLATTMSTQVAMIRYLDNNQNKKTSPNQNFARELMELFLLGVGNYTEADVEASTAAWTGHSDQWNDEVNPYRWRPEWHDASAKDFLGRRINTDATSSAWPGHGPETISVILGNGIVPAGADNVANRGRPTRDVAAEFLSRKLWTSFATDTPPSPGVMDAMRTALTSNDFSVRPWVTAMLTHPDFYSRHRQAGPRAHARRVRRRAAGGDGQTVTRGERDLADGRDGAAAAVPAERQRLAAQRLLGERQRHGRAGPDGAELRTGRRSRNYWSRAVDGPTHARRRLDHATPRSPLGPRGPSSSRCSPTPTWSTDCST